jgi:flagellin-specific chaperone FliS
MIKFFRKIRQHLLTENKFSKYLLYAFGEIALVMIGILLALQVNNWNEGRKELRKSFDIMREIRENLEYNNEQFKREIKEEESVINSIDIVRENLKFNKGYHDSLDFHFLNVAYWPGAIMKSSGYETLKSQGVETIKSDTLRKAIIDLYEGTYEQIKESKQLSENNAAVTMWPMFTALFETQASEPNQSFQSLKVKPFDYEKVVKSQPYTGFLSWWRHSRVVSVEQRMNAIVQNKEVLTMLSKELED